MCRKALRTGDIGEWRTCPADILLFDAIYVPAGGLRSLWWIGRYIVLTGGRYREKLREFGRSYWLMESILLHQRRFNAKRKYDDSRIISYWSREKALDQKALCILWGSLKRFELANVLYNPEKNVCINHLDTIREMLGQEGDNFIFSWWSMQGRHSFGSVKSLAVCSVAVLFSFVPPCEEFWKPSYTGGYLQFQ